MSDDSASIPREMRWSDEVGGVGHCPDCRGILVPGSRSYLMVLRCGTDVDSMIVGSSGGYFCRSCPVVVLDRDKFEDYAAMSAIAGAEAKYAVLGVVDWSTIPDSKSHMPIDDADNPVPLVKFTNLDQDSDSSPS